ncbi:MAG: iron ABC transporter permease [Dehalococcoidia bacterium]
MDEGGPPLRTWFRDRKAALALLGPALVFFAVFLAYPLQGIVRESFAHGGGIEPLVEDAYFLERAWFTAWQATVSSVITLALAIPVAYVLACYEFRGKAALEALITVPFVLPTIVVAVAFTALLGPRGIANDALQSVFGLEEPPIRLLNTIWAILIAHVFYNVALAARIISVSWARVDTRLEDAAAMLGAGKVTTFVRVTLPLLRTPILAAGSLVFLFCFTSFGVVLILGGPEFGTIETEIYRETLFLFRLPVAATLALAQLAATFAMMWVNAALQRRTAQPGAMRRRTLAWTPARRVAVASIIAAVAGLTILPLAALAERSIHGDGGYTLEYYRRLDDNVRQQILFVAPLTAVRNSVTFALLTMLIALPLGTAAAHGATRMRSSLAEAVIQLPLGVSAVSLGLGFLITLDRPPLDLRGSPAMVVIAHSLVALPFVARTVAAQLRSLDPRLREAAAMLGATPVRTFIAIDLPLTWRSMLAGGVFAFAVSMGEFGATLLIARPEYPTIPLAVFRYLGQPGALNYGQALAMATILMAVTAAGFFIIDRLRYREFGGF